MTEQRNNLIGQLGLKELTEVEEDELGLDGRAQLDDEGNGNVDEQQPQHHPLQLPHHAQPEHTHIQNSFIQTLLAHTGQEALKQGSSSSSQLMSTFYCHDFLACEELLQVQDDPTRT